MALLCPRSTCLGASFGPSLRPSVRRGFFYRKSDRKKIYRFRCKHCSRYFSLATSDPCFGLKKRTINPHFIRLLCSGVSMRRCARILAVHDRTIQRRLVFFASIARLRHADFLETLKSNPCTSIQFDELKTSEHTKLKPLSVPIAVQKKTRKILAIEVCRIPADGLLARQAVAKYGFRPNERDLGLERLFEVLKSVVHPEAAIMSDEWPGYPKHVRRVFPRASYTQVKGERGAVVGQGELKKVKFDPLFSLNHTCAMLRANICRLIRRTWCTTKRRDRLLDHLMIYTVFHNEVLTEKERGPRKRPPSSQVRTPNWIHGAFSL